MIDKNARIDIPCPSCGTKRSVSIREIKNNPIYTCLGCNKEINLDASEFTKSLKDLEKTIKNSFKF